MNTQCKVDVNYAGFLRTCNRFTKITVDGVGYCGVHDPVRRRKAEIAREKKIRDAFVRRQRLGREEQKARELRDAKAAAFDEVLAAVDDPVASMVTRLSKIVTKFRRKYGK